MSKQATIAYASRDEIRQIKIHAIACGYYVERDRQLRLAPVEMAWFRGPHVETVGGES